MSENKQILRPDGQPWGRDSRQRHLMSQGDILYVAQQLESQRIPFIVNVGHGDDPFLDIQTVEMLLNAAPNMCLGLNVTETEGAEKAPYFIEHFVRPLLDLCVDHGNKLFIMDEKNTWWASIAAIPEIRDILFDPKYRDVLIPSVEDSNSRTPDLNLAARVGLWLNGSVNRWGCRMAADWFSFSRAWEWEYPMSGHPHLRYFISHMSLGASVFTMSIGAITRDGYFARNHFEAITPFLHMLGKGIIAPPVRDQLRSISPVVLSVEQPTDRFHTSGHNGHYLSIYNAADLQEHVFSRLDCYWGITPTPIWDPAAYLWGRSRQFGNHVPKTPYGYVAVLADTLRETGAMHWDSQWVTDGDWFYKDAQMISALAGRSELESTVAESVNDFPIRIAGDIFYQVVEPDSNRFLAYLADPGWIDPSDRVVHIEPKSGGPWYVLNRLTGDVLGTLDAKLTTTVPAGTPMILEITTDIPTALTELEVTNPLSFQLRRTYPNPFNNDVAIEIVLPNTADIILDIYNILGQRVRRLVNGQTEAGIHTLRWNGSNDQGRACATGVYLLRLVSDDAMRTAKVLLLR